MSLTKSKLKHLNEDHVLSLVIGDPNKKIDKELLEMLLQQNQIPTKLLQEESPLIDYLRQHCPNDLKAAISIYDKITIFYLLRIGPYCAIVNEGQEFLIFDRQLVTYLSVKKNEEDTWGGFAYKKNKSAYVGGFLGEESQGKGRGIFLEGELYHDFIGIWEKGEITKGECTTYSRQTNEVKIHYEGEFKNFQYHGQGTRTKKGKTVTGYFNMGLRTKVNPKALMTESNVSRVQIEEPKSRKKNGRNSRRHAAEEAGNQMPRQHKFDEHDNKPGMHRLEKLEKHEQKNRGEDFMG